MAMPTNAALPFARGGPRTRTALLFESIALRHQIAVLERSRTRRPCFRLWDRLFWILFSRWWPRWRDRLIIVQPETVLRWRREGWSALWRGGRPRVSSEVRHLIVRMARENFLWGAPRIHGELLMLGFSVSQATVSRYLPARSRRPGQSWRTFLRNQAMAFAQYSEERSRDTRACMFCPIGLSSSDPGVHESQRYGLGAGAALPINSRLSTFEEQVCAPRSAIAVHHTAAPWGSAGKRSIAAVLGPLFRSEVHRVKLGCSVTVTAS
ncbi:MAG: helix-turn-helix domain-containing protein [Candidatus Binataceae bacterium]|jgi:hypothetical protein